MVSERDRERKEESIWVRHVKVADKWLLRINDLLAEYSPDNRAGPAGPMFPKSHLKDWSKKLSEELAILSSISYRLAGSTFDGLSKAIVEVHTRLDTYYPDVAPPSSSPNPEKRDRQHIVVETPETTVLVDDANAMVETVETTSNNWGVSVVHMTVEKTTRMLLPGRYLHEADAVRMAEQVGKNLVSDILREYMGKATVVLKEVTPRRTWHVAVKTNNSLKSNIPYEIMVWPDAGRYARSFPESVMKGA